jgi:NAD(P)-dependent dehydrogenase (short-subunit alcohol dehydrogenase family)
VAHALAREGYVRPFMLLHITHVSLRRQYTSHSLLSCHLLLADVQASHLDSVVSSCRDATSSDLSIQTSLCNVADKSQVQTAISAADNIAYGVSGTKASILVNCAGITRDAKISNISDTDWEDVLGVNLKGTFYMCQAFCQTDRAVSLLTSGNGGSIINIGSIVSEYGNVGQCNYAASKGGVVGLTRALAKEMALLSFKVAQSNADLQMLPIRVNCIQPG